MKHEKDSAPYFLFTCGSCDTIKMINNTSIISRSVKYWNLINGNRPFT